MSGPNDPQTLWVDATNLVLMAVTALCGASVAWGVISELWSLHRARRRSGRRHGGAGVAAALPFARRSHPGPAAQACTGHGDTAGGIGPRAQPPRRVLDSP